MTPPSPVSGTPQDVSDADFLRLLTSPMLEQAELLEGPDALLLRGMAARVDAIAQQLTARDTEER